MIRLIRLIHELTWLLATLQEGNMLKTWAGIIKVVTYVASAAGLIFGWLPVETVVAITVVMSAIAKIAEIIVGLTPSTADDARVKEIIDILKKNGIIK